MEKQNNQSNMVNGGKNNYIMLYIVAVKISIINIDQIKLIIA